MNSIHLLQQYVERQNKVWLSVEMDKGRGVDLADVEDPLLYTSSQATPC